MIIEIKLLNPIFCDGCPFLKPYVIPIVGNCGYEVCDLGYSNSSAGTKKCILIKPGPYKNEIHIRPKECIDENDL